MYEGGGNLPPPFNNFDYLQGCVQFVLYLAGFILSRCVYYLLSQNTFLHWHYVPLGFGIVDLTGGIVNVI